MFFINVLKETEADRSSRPKPELLFNIPDFLRSMLCSKKDTWRLKNESSPTHVAYSGNKTVQTHNFHG